MPISASRHGVDQIDNTILQPTGVKTVDHMSDQGTRIRIRVHRLALVHIKVVLNSAVGNTAKHRDTLAPER